MRLDCNPMMKTSLIRDSFDNGQIGFSNPVVEGVRRGGGGGILAQGEGGIFDVGEPVV